MSKRPSFQFYPGDWLTDAALRTCSMEARGLWIDMLCYMHQGTPYGHLKVNDKVILPPNLARMVGLALEDLGGLLAELEGAGVFARDEAGCIVSRRMIRDENVRRARAEGGKKGGNPTLMGGKIDADKVGERLTLEVKQKPTPSSPSSSSVTNVTGGEPPNVWDLWVSVAGERQRSVLGKLIKQHGEQRVAEAVAQTIGKRPADPVGYINGILAPKKRVAVY